MEEIWVDIHGFEGFYQVSNLGRIRSVDRVIQYKDGRKRYYKGQIIKCESITSSGYYEAKLKISGRLYTPYVHRLVAEHFCPNPYNKPTVNHNDENKLNNRADNLTWMTQGENNTYNDLPHRRKYEFTPNHQKALSAVWKKNKKEVDQFDVYGNYIGTYSCAKEAAQAVGLKRPCSVQSVCSGRKKTAGGYIWKYKIS